MRFQYVVAISSEMRGGSVPKPLHQPALLEKPLCLLQGVVTRISSLILFGATLSASWCRPPHHKRSLNSSIVQISLQSVLVARLDAFRLPCQQQDPEGVALAALAVANKGTERHCALELSRAHRDREATDPLVKPGGLAATNLRHEPH